MTKACPQCSIPFTITDSDRVFYIRVSPGIDGGKMLLPEPSLCSKFGVLASLRNRLVGIEAMWGTARRAHNNIIQKKVNRIEPPPHLPSADRFAASASMPYTFPAIKRVS